jgi:hypothetical protein
MYWFINFQIIFCIKFSSFFLIYLSFVLHTEFLYYTIQIVIYISFHSSSNNWCMFIKYFIK